MRWAGHIARIGETRVVNLRERDHLGDPGVDGRIILRKWDVRMIGTGGGHL